MRQYLKNEVFKISKWVELILSVNHNHRGHRRNRMAGTGSDPAYDGDPSGNSGDLPSSSESHLIW